MTENAVSVWTRTWTCYKSIFFGEREKEKIKKRKKRKKRRKEKLPSLLFISFFSFFICSFSRSSKKRYTCSKSNANPKRIKKDAFSKRSGYVWTGPKRLKNCIVTDILSVASCYMTFYGEKIDLHVKIDFTSLKWLLSVQGIS